ncbi:MAG: hypothetical protein AAFQ74_20240 [Cyanobacteria bacterium J06623_4]
MATKRTMTKQVAAKRVAGLGLSSLGLLLGFLCLGRAAETAVDPDPNRLDKRETVIAGLMLGVPATVGALCMLRAVKRDRLLAHSQRLQALFYKAICANDGRINVIQFAMLAEVSLVEARECLDAWAGSLNADFDIDDAGLVVYCFPSLGR